MTLVFIGMVQPRLQSEIHPADKLVVLDKGYLKEFTQAHEEGGFDRVLCEVKSVNAIPFNAAEKLVGQSGRQSVCV